MSDNHIRFTIGSEFSGEGFKKAQAAVKEVNADIKAGAASASRIASAFGEMDSAASKNLQAITGLATAILSFNATAIATQVAMIAINQYFGEMKERAEAAQKAANELKVSMEKSFSSALQTSVAGINKEVSNIITEFETATKQANAFAAALEGVRASEANGGLVNLQLEKLNKLLEAHGDAEREAIESTYNLKIAIEKSANVEAEWVSKQEAAHQAVVDSQNRVAKIDEQIVILGEKRAELEATMNAAKESGDEHWRTIQTELNKLVEQETALEQKKLNVEAETDVLREKEKQVKQDAINAQNQATIAIREAELAEQKLAEAKHNRQVKEEAARDAADEKAAAELLDAQELKTAAEIQADANKAAKDLAAAERDYAAKLAAYNAGDIVRDAALAQVSKGGLSGGKNLIPVDVQKSIQTTVADAKVDDAIRNGAVNTVKDADRLQRQAMREARDTITKEQRQQLREAQKYAALQKMNPKALASSDKEFMAKYEKIQAAAEKRKQDLEKAKKAVEDSGKKIEETNKTLKEIDKKLNKLGLK